MTPLSLGTEFSVIFLYDKEKFEHLIQVQNFKYYCTLQHSHKHKLVNFVLSTLKSWPSLNFSIFMQKTSKISQNFKLAISWERTGNHFINCGVIS